MVKKVFQLPFDGVSVVSFIVPRSSYVYRVVIRTCGNRWVKTIRTTEVRSFIFKCRYQHNCGKHDRYYTIKTHLL
ncbi:hypothetical protein PBCV1_a198R [Paramecium bursaria Chlorella virus 1]|uniref:Uncharacterized protein n=1 Tax=Paramecium bursaria Chlorella virus 1 TaxID=10506 RepID=Q84518_PBCV1|nr:hypothetical protein PBCV1_a198R [Paramecium bursaria Chlorella virus 1]AAC96566.1 hypothetical protein [Paramecium bursaria Chlorella virus 1]